MATKNYLVFDIGASNGRAVVARFDGERFVAEVAHRFDNRPVLAAGTLYWDILRLFSEVTLGLQRSVKEYPDMVSVGVDTWGADFGLIDRNGKLLANPIHYRDQRRHEVSAEIFELMPAWEMFQSVGIFIASIMSVFQLYAMKVDRSPPLARASSLLLIPDLIHYLLSGEVSNEFTNACGTAAFDQMNKRWETRILERLGIPADLFSPTVMPGTMVGRIQPSLCRALECPALPVIAPATHDTASAVAGIPVVDAKTPWAFISLGTWCVVGTETASPVVSSEVFYSGFGNEGGADGRSFLAVNITGLWILQRCREKWAQYAGREISWEEIVRGALSAPRFRSFIDVDHSSFGASPADMPGVIGDYCGDKGIRRPAGMGETARCVFESLVMKFRWRLEQLERLTSIRAGVVHLVGGGVRNEPLCQWTADATGKRVIAGPVETTVAGNLIMQMKGSGEIADLEEGRRIVAASSETREYAPKDAASWEEAFVVYAAAIR